MANKWEITLDVDESEVDLLVVALEREATRSIHQEGDFDYAEEIEALEAKIKLAWTEREVEIHEPPNKWSKTLWVADARSSNSENGFLEGRCPPLLQEGGAAGLQAAPRPPVHTVAPEKPARVTPIR